MSDFNAKMHKIRFLLGLCPRPRWGSLQRSPDLLDVFKGGLLIRKGRKKAKGKREGKGRGWRKA